MTCPYCGKEMEAGYFHGSKEYKWVKENGPSKRERPMGTAFTVGRRVGQYSMWGVTLKGFRCEKCGKIVIDVNNQ